jgi:hypothetical protein
MLWTVPPLWDSGACFILGGGPSVPRQFNIPNDIVAKVMAGELPASTYSPYFEAIHNKHVIGINNAYMIGTWIDISFFGDAGWYVIHRLGIAKFPNLKVTCCNRFADRPAKAMEGIKYLKKDKEAVQGISKNKSAVAWNNNSGAASISLAVHLGVKKIYLLGFDMSLDKNQISHWHGTHNREKKIVPPFWRHLRGFPLIAEQAKELGVQIFNCSNQSAIKDFPIMTVEEALNDSNKSAIIQSEERTA